MNLHRGPEGNRLAALSGRFEPPFPDGFAGLFVEPQAEAAEQVKVSSPAVSGNVNLHSVEYSFLMLLLKGALGCRAVSSERAYWILAVFLVTLAA